METIIMGLYRDYLGYIFWGYMGIMEEKMETAIVGYMGYRIWGIGVKDFNLRYRIMSM